MPAHKRITDSLEKKLYGLIISRLEGENIRSQAYRERIFDLAEKGISGFIFFGGQRDEVRFFIDEIQSIPEIPLFIASDIERGVGQQVEGRTLFPCQMALSAAIDRSKPENVTILREVAGAVADEAKDVGINMPLIPVLDVNRDPENPIICTRAFSDDPEDVASFGSEYINVLESSGLISCAKHFPGHGDTSADSHISLPVIHKSGKDLMDTDIVPFKEAIRRGVSSIMVGHLSIPAVDDEPASLSKKIITDILRNGLGFDGLIMTDALNMNALNEFEKVPARCIKAGVDILLHPFDPDAAVKELMSAVESEEISNELIEAAAGRILRVKARLKKSEKKDIDYRRHKMLSSQISEMSVSLLKNTTGLLPIRDQSAIPLTFVGDYESFDTAHMRNYFAVNSGDGKQPDVKGKTCLICIFTNVAAWKGSSGISEYEISRTHDLIGNSGHSIVISFGSPYVLRHFNDADILIAAYEATEQAQKAVIKCLDGRLDFKGRLPVRISF